MPTTEHPWYFVSDDVWAPSVKRVRPPFAVLRMELVRKSIHLLVVLVPTMASLHREGTIAVLAAGVLAYTAFEAIRRSGRTVPIVSRLTVLSQRERDRGRFVLGPVTLGAGALLSLLLFPSNQAAIAIYALGFGDGLSSLVGRFAGRIDLPFTKGKSLEGSFTCFTAVFLSTIALRSNLSEAALIAAFATLIEAIPAGDLDNILLPLGTGAMATILVFAGTF